MESPAPAPTALRSALQTILLAVVLAVTALAYWPGLSGGFLFDDYPNIVDNHALQIKQATIPNLVSAALSSPSSEFKRPLASLSFAANCLATGLDPYWMKLTNLLIHLLNGVVMFLLARALLECAARRSDTSPPRPGAGWVALLITAGWLLLPINLTGVLYVVQRMESLANLFVLLGLLGYVQGRRRMLAGNAGFLRAGASVILATVVGITAKETAVMTPLYAFLIEWTVFRGMTAEGRRDHRITAYFLLVLVLPLIAGLCWLLPGLLQPSAWATRDFTLGERLLSEARIVVDYIRWTLLPTPHALSFYHDDYTVSTGLLQPWTTLPSILALAALLALGIGLRNRHPIAALGILLFLGAHTLTATILPLELIYEHRNYFPSFGLLLAVVPLLTSTRMPMPLARYTLLVGLLVVWAGQTASSAYAWGNTLRLSRTLAERAPDSPRAQYDLGRTDIILSHYDPQSPFTQAAYAPLERAMRLPDSSILPEQALIFMNAKMGKPIKAEWWDSLIAKLKAHTPGVQDVSSLESLAQCAADGSCSLPKDRMVEAFLAALSHPHPGARLLAIYGDYAWNALDDHALGLRMAEDAAQKSPATGAYVITEFNRRLATGDVAGARSTLEHLRRLNIGGRFDGDIEAATKQLASY